MQRRTERLVLWALAIVVAGVCVRASVWQYGRAEWKQQYLQSWQAALDSAAEPLRAEDIAQKVETPKRVEVDLDRANARWILLDNQQRDGKVGLRAYALYRLADQSPLLIEFGWVPMMNGRQLPTLDVPPEHLHVQGMLLPWPGQGIALASNPWPMDEAPVLVTYLDREEIGRGLGGLQLSDAVLRIAGDAESEPFTRDAVALPNTLSPEQHYGYALQWAGLAITTLIVAVILHVRSVRK